MSVQAITAALIVQGVKDTEKLLLIVLANYADEDMQCWPSQERLAKDTCMSVRSVGRCFLGLEKAGYVERHQRRRDDGFRASDLIVLRLNSAARMSHDKLSPDKQSHDKPANLTRQKRTISHDRLAEPTTFEPTIEPSIEPSLVETGVSKVKSIRSKPFPKAEFERWYSAYPRHVSRGAAEKAFTKALGQTNIEVLVSAAQSYAQETRGKEPQFIAHPSTWLNNKRWMDETEAIRSSSGVVLYIDEGFAARQAALLEA